MADYDITIIGAGPGGYVAAIRAAQLGFKTALIEKSEIGGTCLNWGCIPSKALLKNAEVLELVKDSNTYGITIDSFVADYEKGYNRSRDVVSKLVTGINHLLNKNKVDVIHGSARFVSKSSLLVDITDPNDNVGERIQSADELLIESKNIIIATGGVPRELPQAKFDGDKILNSKQVLEMKKLPKSLGIIGAGPIGVEFASLFNSYGVEVTLIEMLSDVVPNEDKEISSSLNAYFTKRGINILTETKLNSVKTTSKNISLQLSGKDDEEINLKFDKILVAIGIAPSLESLGIDSLDIKLSNGWIDIDSSMTTNIPNIFAIGDVTGVLPLAHVAQAQAVLAIERIHGDHVPDINYINMPKATYCNPQIASFGLSEEQAGLEGYNVKIGKFPFLASGKAIAASHSEGFCKIVVDSEYGEILGVHLIGADVTELLAELSMIQALEGTVDELALLTHAHPTLSETLKEAALAALGNPIHI
jgi:dihydrolipoamide dehydrogenase